MAKFFVYALFTMLLIYIDQLKSLEKVRLRFLFKLTLLKQKFGEGGYLQMFFLIVNNIAFGLFKD